MAALGITATAATQCDDTTFVVSTASAEIFLAPQSETSLTFRVRLNEAASSNARGGTFHAYLRTNDLAASGVRVRMSLTNGDGSLADTALFAPDDDTDGGRFIDSDGRRLLSVSALQQCEWSAPCEESFEVVIQRIADDVDAGVALNVLGEVAAAGAPPIHDLARDGGLMVSVDE